MSIGHFLGGIGALIWNPSDRKYLVLRRAAQRDFKGGSWECVTGRVDQGESFEQALHREVREEINGVVQIDFIIGTTHFYRGAETPENELLGIIYGCTLLDPHGLQFSDEHSEQRWVTAEEALRMLPGGHWLRTVIERAEMLRQALPEELLRFYRKHGFEI
jgi:8-oxo-dGTP diphosphatase